jgi:AKAP7 2'5' RNA ligase-like domain
VTHFLAFPIQSPLVSRRLEEFYKILGSPSFREDGITQESIAPIPSLHITLGVMKLMGQSEIEAAVRFLKESAADTINSLIGERGLTVRLKKLDIMQGDPGKFNVDR